MEKTENYGLNKWGEHDEIKHEDFNADNAKIDAAIRGNADAINTVITTMPKIATGTYIGDGAYGRIIPLEFTPTAVIVWMDGAKQAECNSSTFYGGVAVKDKNCQAVGITNYGFKVYYSDNVPLRSNSSNGSYTYIAFG